MPRPKFDEYLNLSDARQKACLIAYIEQADGWHQIQMTAGELTRSEQQNKSWWKFRVWPFAERIMEQEEEHGNKELVKQAAHYVLVKHLLGLDEFTDPETGELCSKAKETHTLKVSEFNDLFERAAVWLAKRGVFCSDPDPTWWHHTQPPQRRQKVMR